MENEKRKYWFFGSKLNTALLLILIILMVIALKWMNQDRETYLPVIKQEQTSNNSWTSSPSNFGSIVSYPSDWQITPQYYGSAAMQAAGEESLVGYTFNLPSGSIITWGGAQSGCSENEFGEFKYGVSNLTCIKGYRTSIGRASAREILSSSDLEIFGDFVLRNK